MFLMEEFGHLKIQLQEVISATDNFSPNKLIGQGGFGKVYKGEISLSGERSMVALKRLDRKFGQGNTEFWKEIMMLSKCKHENLVSLLHFCLEGDERILVYEYASRGSLDRHLSDASLTWMQRLRICLGVARGLNYLHDPMETKQRILHRDIKSSNILLDEEWNAKISDFGLSKVGPANQPRTYLVSNVVGTFGYCDPTYFETALLTKESDVYSFGVVLFEVMCGKFCCEYRNGEMISLLVPMWKKCFEEDKLDDIILHDLKEQIQPDSLVAFSTIANRCLQRDHKKRPTMMEIVQELEVAVERQIGINNNEESDDNTYLIKHAGVKLEQATARKHEADRRITIRVHAPRIGNTEVPPEDGYTWRKYGQKEILGSKFPRGYYRCAYQKLYNCLARKQVQRLDNDPYTFEVRYRGDHTCTMSSTAPSMPPPSLPEAITTYSTSHHIPPTTSQPLKQRLSIDVKQPLAYLYSNVTHHNPGAGPSSPTRYTDYTGVTDLVDTTFNSDSSSNNSMELIFSSEEIKDDGEKIPYI